MDSEEFNTWISMFGRERMIAIYKKYREQIKRDPAFGERINYPEDQGWILLQPDEVCYVEPDDIQEQGTVLPGGAIYIKLKEAVS